MLPRSSAANRLLGIMVHGLGVKIMMNMIIIVDGLVSGADTEKLERHIFRMYDSNKVGGALPVWQSFSSKYCEKYFDRKFQFR